MTAEELEEMIKEVEWEQFQEPSDGYLYVYHKPEMIRFAYRIGLHFKRPMEAIMAKGSFVRMRAAPQYVSFHLVRLDPENVNTCLYEGYQIANDSFTKSWHPKYPPNPLNALNPLNQPQIGGSIPTPYFGTIAPNTTTWTANTTNTTNTTNLQAAQNQALQQYQQAPLFSDQRILGGLANCLGIKW